MYMKKFQVIWVISEFFMGFQVSNDMYSMLCVLSFSHFLLLEFKFGFQLKMIPIEFDLDKKMYTISFGLVLSSL